jgi:hypothetical protein
MENLERQFHHEMLDIYRKASEQCNYQATRFLQLVNNLGGINAARALLHSSGLSEGFIALWERKRLDLTMEALILKSPWRDLFTQEKLEIARKRLQDLGFET